MLSLSILLFAMQAPAEEPRPLRNEPVVSERAMKTVNVLLSYGLAGETPDGFLAYNYSMTRGPRIDNAELVIDEINDWRHYDYEKRGLKEYYARTNVEKKRRALTMKEIGGIVACEKLKTLPANQYFRAHDSRIPNGVWVPIYNAKYKMAEHCKSISQIQTAIPLWP